MAEENGTSKLTFFLIGFGLGAVVALLFAPKSGKELRSDIAESTRRGLEKASETYDTTRERAKALAASGREKAGEWIEDAKEAVTSQKGRIAAAYEAGKQAYREEKERLTDES
jgi:gas vesicle protein